MSKYLLSIIALMSLSSPIQAHLLKVFAYSTGDEVIGSVYFAGGDPAGDVELKVSGATGWVLSTLRSDAEGRFRYPITHPEAQHIRAFSGDGHSAQWTISKAELGTIATPGPDNNSADSSGRNPGNSSGDNSAGDPNTIGSNDATSATPRSANLSALSGDTDSTENISRTRPSTELSEAMIERAVARQLGPLRLQLEQQQDRARLSDILGGIGIIFGLAGITMWWRSRRLLVGTSSSSASHSSPHSSSDSK